MSHFSRGQKMNIRDIIQIIIQNAPEIIIVVIVSPIQVLMIEKFKKWFPKIKKYKRGIFLLTFLSSTIICFSVTVAGWISWKSIFIVFLAISFTSI